MISAFDISRRTDFTTDDPDALREELRRFYEDAFSELERVRREASGAWSKITMVPDGETVYATIGQVVAISTGLVLTPKGPSVGEAFRVLHTSAVSGVTVRSDVGDLVAGSTAGETRTSSGWFEYVWHGTELGWYRQAI